MCYFEQDGVKISLPSKLLQKVEEGGNNIVYHYRRAQMGMRFGTAQIPPSLSLSLPFSAPLCHVSPYFDNLSPSCGSRERNGAGATYSPSSMVMLHNSSHVAKPHYAHVHRCVPVFNNVVGCE